MSDPSLLQRLKERKLVQWAIAYSARYEKAKEGEFLNGEHPRVVEVQEERSLRFE
jgi:hypothetical protein